MIRIFSTEFSDINKPMNTKDIARLSDSLKNKVPFENSWDTKWDGLDTLVQLGIDVTDNDYYRTLTYGLSFINRFSLKNINVDLLAGIYSIKDCKELCELAQKANHNKELLDYKSIENFIENLDNKINE